MSATAWSSGQADIYPDAMRAITDKIGVDGLVELGRVSKREVGTKVNHGRGPRT